MREKEGLGNNNKSVTKMNRSMVVRILKQRGQCSRAEISDEMGLTQAAITKMVADLINIGIVVEVGLLTGKAGRRSIALQLNAGIYRVIGVKFSRQVFSVGVFDISGKVYRHEDFQYDLNEAPKTVISKIKQAINWYIDEYEHIVAIGIAVPGPYLKHQGKIAVITQMPAWKKVNFSKEFIGSFKIPAFIEHDANAACLAEYWFGETGKNTNNLVYFLIGDGVGSGVVNDGELLIGALGSAAEIGHISIDNTNMAKENRCQCGNYGCLELYSSEPAIVKRAQKICPEIDSFKKVFDSARQGNKAMMTIVEDLAHYISYGCINLIHSYNPEIITIGDKVSSGADLFLPIVRKMVKERIQPDIANKTKIEVSESPIDPILYGAAAIATDKVLELPDDVLKNR